MRTLQERAQIIEAEGIFLGGPSRLFELAGRKTLMTLLNEGLNPWSKVLDIGCGCLRGGYWLIHFLDHGCYFGIEPNKDMLNAGTRILLEPQLLEQKHPRFDHNYQFDFSVFGEQFDYFVARSIWTHASKQQIQTMLDGFVNTSSTNGVFITSYIKASLFKHDYKGSSWVGKSHETSAAGIVGHSFSWIQNECAKRALTAKEIKGKEINFGKQTWICIKRKA